jgi:excisionase family DNA binding protein
MNKATQKAMSPNVLITVSAACAALGIGRTSLYRMLNTRHLEARKIGRRTLIVAESLEHLIGNLPAFRPAGEVHVAGGRK